MTVNLNRGVAQGTVIAITPFDNNTRITLAIADDYKDKNQQWVNRSYIAQFAFFGEGTMSMIERVVEKGAQLTIEYKLTSYIPKNSEYHTIALTGVSLYATPKTREDSEAQPQAPRRAPSRKAPKPVIEDDDDEEVLPW